MKRRPRISECPAQRRCIIEATIDHLRPFPRGYARSKLGPFFSLRMVGILLELGALRRVPNTGYLRLLTARSS